MFYLKFISNSESHSAETLIACPHYEAYTNSATGDTTITTYKNMLINDGVERHITDDEKRAGRFDACFVMSESGKTIETYRKKHKASHKFDSSGCRFGCQEASSHVAVFDHIDESGIVYKKKSKYKYCDYCAKQIDPMSLSSAMM